MVTNSELEMHIEHVILDYFRQIPNKATPQLYLHKMYHVYSSLILLKRYEQFSDKWIRFDAHHSVYEWYKSIEFDCREVLVKYTRMLNQCLPSESMKKILEINNLMAIIRWIMEVEAMCYG